VSVSFIVLGAPRSGTTWAANWLTTDHTFCLHDPLVEYKVSQLNNMVAPGRRLGVSCTSLLWFPEWVNEQRCPKVILFREMGEINLSLDTLGLQKLDENAHMARIAAIKDARLVPYGDLFKMKTAEKLAKYLGVPFDPPRHDLLRQMRIEPTFKHINVNPDAVKELINRMKAAYNE
jgi:hypothetical protein